MPLNYPDDYTQQTVRVFAEMRRVLTIAGGTLQDLTTVEVILVENNSVNSRIFNDTRVAILSLGPFPASMKQGGQLTPNGISKVEIQGIAEFPIPARWKINNPSLT